MADAYSFDRDQATMGGAYARVHAAYARIFERCGLPVRSVEAASGMMGGHASHEFMYLSEHGEDQLLTCAACGYAANVEGARARLLPLPPEEPLPLTPVATPGMTTIVSLARFLGVEASRTLKAVLYQRADTGALVFVVIRGDLEVNEAKLSALLGGVGLEPAQETTLATAGIVPGYASPIGIKGCTVVADESVQSAVNYVAGANREGFHWQNVNVPRDFQPDLRADIALARPGDHCPACGAALASVRAIEVGHIFQLGTRYTEALGAHFLDEQGHSVPLQMGCYGIGLGRLMACIIEEHHDAQGPIWPAAVAPFDVHLVSLVRPGSEESGTADALYARLGAAGLAVLYDDRPERAGVKFNDADLIGAPVRLTLSARTLAAGSVELRRRRDGQSRDVPLEPLEGLVERIRAEA